VRQPEWIRY